ncbi:Kinesin motor domain [Phytophthora infestans]|uniref:Kinesin motor domain n=1 Tax=Phytophthora infestans TaxID=4787 RepID=A0A8S9UKQ8_PHYIN|nr:Kinesin motor domain [Phytophthora infestans]
MAEEHHLPRIAQPSPRGSSVVYSGRQVPLLELAFQGGDFSESHHGMPSSRSTRSRHEDEYVASSTSRVSNGGNIQAALPRTAASWHAGNGSAVAYDSTPLTDESAIMEASDPALFQAAVEEHSRRLGIDPTHDAAFMWIARESLVAPLPDGWYHVTATETGQPYYYNEISGESRWDHPSDDHFRQVYREMKHKQVKAHAFRDPHPAGYYDTGGYQSGTAWQENGQDHHVQYAAQTHQGWGREQVQGYYHGYEASYKVPEAQVYPPRQEVSHPVTDSASTSVSSSGDNQRVRKVQEMEEQKVKDDEAVMSMKTEVNDLKRQVSSRDKALEATKGRVHELTGELSELKQQMEESTKDREEIIMANQTLQNELSLARSGMEGSTKTHEELLEAQQTLTKELAVARAKLKEEQLGETEGVESLQSQLFSEQSARAQLEQQLEQATKQQAGLTKKFEAAQATIQRLQENLSMKENNEAVAAAASATATATATIKAISKQLAEKDKALEDERARVVSLEEDIVQLRASQTSAQETLEQDLQTQLGTLAAQAEARRKELETTKSSLTSTTAEKVELKKHFEEYKITSAAQISELEDQQRALKREFRAIERELKTQQGLAKGRGDESMALKQELESAEIKLASVAQTIQKERMEAYNEAQQASAEIVRQANEEKARVAELYTQEMLARRKLHNRLMELQGNIRVFCRVRPIQPVEMKSEQSSLAVFFRDNDHESLDLFVGSEAGDKASQVGQKHAFEFDHVFQPDSTQEQVFEQTRALVVSALDGFNVCIFAYGQTGSGKTHTMEGPESDRGVNFRALRELFSIRDDRMAAGNFECSMKLSILEVYNESIVDLLEGGGRTPGVVSLAKGLDVRVGKTGVYVENLIEVEVFNEGDVLDLMRLGHSHRSVGSHDFNEHSSRSHLVLSIVIETGMKSDTRRRISKLHLIDLAGSERVSKTAASGQRLKEAQNINRSLSALGDVIAALGANSKHVPYRNSKLTFLLQDSLSGNSKVLMFVNVSPVQWNAWETLCSLNFASRCRSVALGQVKAASGGHSQGNGMQATMSMSAMIPGRSMGPGSRPVPSR